MDILVILKNKNNINWLGLKSLRAKEANIYLRNY